MVSRKLNQTSYNRRPSAGVQVYHDDAVLLGNWFEERSQKEIERERLMKAFENNELPFQKLDRYTLLLEKSIQLTRNLDGFLHHGDVIRLKWSDEEQQKTFYLSALPQNIAKNGTFNEPCWVIARDDSRVMVRNAFNIFRNNNSVPNHVPLAFGELIIICTFKETGHRLLNCEPKNCKIFADKSGKEVTFVKELSGRGLWRILCNKKDDRLKTEGQYIPCNTDVVVHHVASGQNLAVEERIKTKTAFGHEREISVMSYINRYGEWNDCAKNIWQIDAPLIKPDDYSEPIKLPYEKEL